MNEILDTIATIIIIVLVGILIQEWAYQYFTVN